VAVAIANAAANSTTTNPLPTKPTFFVMR
jgi:hypothetical protein